MRKDAESHAEEDKKKRQLAELRNQADSMAWQVEKLIKEHDAKLHAADKEARRSKAIDEGPRSCQERRSRRASRAAVNELEQASHALSKTLYESHQGGAGAAAGAAGQSGDGKKPGDEEVIDAEFEVKE